MSAPQLEDALLNWANGNEARKNKWMIELLGNDIDNMQTLIEWATDDDGNAFSELCARVSAGLGVKLRSWFKMIYPERVNTCTVDEFLNMIPPSIELSHEIVEWSDFDAKARDFVWNVPQRVKKTTLSTVRRSVVGEADVQSCFQLWVLDPFNDVFQEVEEKMEFIRSSSDDACIGSPDFVFNINSTLSSFFELKTLFTLDSHLIDLRIQSAQDDPAVKNTVEQVMGYLNFNGLIYGLLSSYQNTWFLKREADKLFVSKAIAFDNLNPTLYRCIGYLISLVRLSPTELKVDPPLRRSTRIANQDSFNYSGEPDDLVLSRNSLGISSSFSRYSEGYDDFDLPNNFSITKLQECIGSGFCGKVFKWHDSGVTAAVKVCDAYKSREGASALRNEANVYRKLKDIQGKLIPRLLFYGEAWGFYFLATTFIEGHHPTKIQEVQDNLDKVLDKVRESGVIHGDVKTSNVIVSPDNELFLIDFSHARIIISGIDEKYAEMEYS